MMTTDGVQIGKPSIINQSQLSASQIVIKFQSLFNVLIADVSGRAYCKGS